jgi:hypothetical protein
MSISALGSFRAAELGRQAVQRRWYHTDRPGEMGAREKHGYLASLLLSEGRNLHKSHLHNSGLFVLAFREPSGRRYLVQNLQCVDRQAFGDRCKFQASADRCFRAELLRE